MNARFSTCQHPRRWLALCLVAILWSGCGYVGDTLPPALYIPLPVQDLSALQEDSEIVLQFTLPQRSTEDLPLDGVMEIDLRAAVWENRDWDAAAWEREAQPLPVEVNEEAGLARTPVNGFVNRRVLLRVRVAGKKGRFSAWSEPVALRVLPRQETPQAVSANATANGVAVAWSLSAQTQDGPPKQVEVWRRQAAETEFRLVASVESGPYVDEGSVWGEPHSYRLRTRVDADERMAFSRFTDAVNVIPVDTFPPAVPTDLSAVAAASSVELSWSRNAEADLEGYRVYRAVDDAEFVLLSAIVPGSSFSDEKPPTGRRLRYHVTALDTAGNESAPSPAVEALLP